MRSNVEPTKIDFFRTMDKIGGPIEPKYGFSDVYTEIFIKKKTRKQIEEEEDELNEDYSENESKENEDESEDSE